MIIIQVYYLSFILQRQRSQDLSPFSTLEIKDAEKRFSQHKRKKTKILTKQFFSYRKVLFIGTSFLPFTVFHTEWNGKVAKGTDLRVAN